jgi:hypothetical protein
MVVKRDHVFEIEDLVNDECLFYLDQDMLSLVKESKEEGGRLLG